MTLRYLTLLANVDPFSRRARRKDRKNEHHILVSQSSKESCDSIRRPVEALSWKPVTLRPPLLLSIVVLTLAFIAILEYLSQKSQIDGGIAFTKDRFSPAVSFAYLYLPTIIAVLYSILWSWIDLDTKRLEPYFQLSKVEGADITNSLALNYPFDFVAYAPLKALRRRSVAHYPSCSFCLIRFHRHWAVVFVGASTMLIFWGVTPLVSSVFAQSIVKLENQATATTIAALMPLRNQSLAMNTDFMMTAYGIAWLGQEMPGFVTNQGALEPFDLDVRQGKELFNATWKAQTKLYGTSLNCRAADIKNDSSGLSYSNGKDCTTDPGYSPVPSKADSQIGSLYIGYHMGQFSDYSLSGMGCPSLTNKHLFLALWGQYMGDNGGANVSAVFCEPTYWTQEVNATVAVPSMNVSDVSPLGPRIPLPDNMFNRTTFEYNIGTGAQAKSPRADIPETTNIIDQWPRMAELGLRGTITNMVGFAFGLSPANLTDYSNPLVLAAMFENAHKLLHALAIRQLMSSSVTDVQSREGAISGKVNAILIVRPLAIVVEILLGLVVTLILAFAAHTFIRQSHLCNNPASLRDVIAIAADDNSSQDLKNETGPEVSWIRYRLFKGRICASRPPGASHSNDCGLPSSDARSGPTTIEVENQTPLVRPIEMSMTVAFIFMLILLLVLITVILLKIFAEKHHGLSVPSSKTVVNQLVLNYVLIIFATFLEPFWLLLNRQLCVLQPFEELRRANTAASKSLGLTYTSLPPQMNIWNAFRARHYTLSAVCVIGLSANLLAVSLNGLLQLDFVPMEDATNLTRRYEAIYSQDQTFSGPRSASDYQYIAKVNLSDGVALPPWTTSDTFFVPFGLETKSDFGLVSSIRASTQGFSIRPECEPVKTNDTALITGWHTSFYVQQRTPSGGSVFCGVLLTPYGGQNNSNAALEALFQLQPVDPSQRDAPTFPTTTLVPYKGTQEETLTCNSILLAGFLRANLTVSLSTTKTDNLAETVQIHRINSLSSLWLTCKARLATAPYEVNVDSTGRVQSYVPVGPDAKDLAKYFSNGTTPTSLIAGATSILANGKDTHPYWHNDTFVDTWFAYFIKHLSNSTILMDPEQPVPVFEHVAPYVENLYARLFAIVLGLNQDWLTEAEPDSMIPGTLMAPTQRVLVSRPMFIITVVLLVLNMVVALLYWTRRPKKMLPVMPYTIASIMAMVRASGLAAELRKQEEWKKDWKVGYGRYVGTDGKPHIGIERRPFVQPLDT